LAFGLGRLNFVLRSLYFASVLTQVTALKVQSSMYETKHKAQRPKTKGPAC
jgi:hypothetical protein